MAKVLVQYRNTAPIEVDENSVTAKKAAENRGNWKLVNGEKEVKAFEEKKSENADVSDAKAEASNEAQNDHEELEVAQVPTEKPKAKVGRKKANQ